MTRLPVLNKAEMDAIVQDEGTIGALALRYGVSEATIRKIKAGEYVPQEEARTHSSSRLDAVQRLSIALSPGSDKEVGRCYNISASYVRQVRASLRGVIPPPTSLPLEVITAIRQDRETNVFEIGEEYNVPAEIVRAIHRGDFDG